MKFFTIKELTDSETARKQNIVNKPSMEQESALVELINNVLDPARELLGMPIRVTSGYRSQRLNRAVGGVPSSQHTKGEAADLVCADNAKLFAIIRDNLPFDQLIWEKGTAQAPAWVHVSHKKFGNRKQVIKIR